MTTAQLIEEALKEFREKFGTEWEQYDGPYEPTRLEIEEFLRDKINTIATKSAEDRLVVPPKPNMATGDFSTAGSTNLGLSIQYLADILYTIYRDWKKSHV